MEKESEQIEQLASSIKSLWLMNDQKLGDSLAEALAEQIPNLGAEYYYELLGKLSDHPNLCELVETFRTPNQKATSPYRFWFSVSIVVGAVNFIIGMGGFWDDSSPWVAYLMGFSIFWLPIIPAMLDTSWKKKQGIL